MLNSDSDDSDIWRFLAVNVQQFTNLTLDSSVLVGLTVDVV